MEWLKTLIWILRGSGWSWAITLAVAALVYVHVPLERGPGGHLLATTDRPQVPR